MRRTYVLFNSSFRYEQAPNISHETVDGAKTLCGRDVSRAATVEPDSNNLDPDCIACRRARSRMWYVQCSGCGVAYSDRRRRVGTCLHCKSAAIIISKVQP